MQSFVIVVGHNFRLFYFISLIIDFLWNEKKVVAFNLSRLNYQPYNAYDSASLAYEKHYLIKKEAFTLIIIYSLIIIKKLPISYDIDRQKSRNTKSN